MNGDKLIFVLIAGVTVVITAVILFSSFTSNNAQNELMSPEAMIGENPHYKGVSPSEAELVLVEFSDFECPFCRDFWPVVTQLGETYNGRISIVYRHFPIPGHRNAIPAARASEAAANQGKFWEMHDEMFAGAPALAQSDLEGYATAIGLDVEKFKTDMASQDSSNKVTEDYEYGKSVKVMGTPTFFTIHNGEVKPVVMTDFSDLESTVGDLLGQSSGDSTSDGGAEVDEAAVAIPAVADLVNNYRTDLTPSNISVVSVEQMQWPNSALGCPEEGTAYTEAIVPGYVIKLTAAGEEFEYHADNQGNVVTCDPKLKPAS